MTQGFDEWVDKNSLNFHPTDYYLYKDIYEAGQQSRQAEIDELQKRIDEAINLLQGKSISEVYKAIHILKGKEDD